MRIINLDEFEDLRSQGASNLLCCYDEDRKYTIYAVVDKDEQEKSNKELFRLLSEQLLDMRPERGVLRRYWEK